VNYSVPVHRFDLAYLVNLVRHMRSRAVRARQQEVVVYLDMLLSSIEQSAAVLSEVLTDE
jgi:hypothetical protein